MCICIDLHYWERKSSGDSWENVLIEMETLVILNMK